LPKDKPIYKINNIDKGFYGGKIWLHKDDKILVYFDSPFYPNLGEMKLDKNWNKTNYNEKTINKIDQLIEQMERTPRVYHNKIVELSLTEDKKWVPLRVRNDKSLPNSYRVGLNNISIIFDPIKPLESIYFQKNLSLDQEDQKIIHTINKIYRQYIIEK
jgi:hypothetical protein